MGVQVRLKTVLGSTHIVEQLSFSLFPPVTDLDFDLTLGSGYFLPLGSPYGSETVLFSILNFEIDVNLGSFLICGALIGYFWSRGRIEKLFWGLLM